MVSPFSWVQRGGYTLLQSQGQNPVERGPEIIASMNEDGSTIRFPLCRMRNFRPGSFENTFAQTHLGFNSKSHTFWQVELVQFKYKSHLKVISQDQWILSISIHSLHVSLFLESDLPGYLGTFHLPKKENQGLGHWTISSASLSL